MSAQQLQTAVSNRQPERDLSELFEVVSQVLEVPRERLSPETLFVDDLGADSLDIVELAMALEERFDVTVPDESTTQMKSIRDLADLLSSTRHAKAKS